jgi:hypothetical protein
MNRNEQKRINKENGVALRIDAGAYVQQVAVL